MSYFLRYSIILFLTCGVITIANAQEAVFDEEKPLTQAEFAVEMVNILGLQNALPPAPLALDCITLLESYGIAPLKGWNPSQYLTREEYLVLIGKARGKEGMILNRAQAVEERNINLINKRWEESYQAEGRWVTLEELLNNTTYFPEGSPQSPYGFAYQDQNGDHRVDPYFSVIANLHKLRELLSAR